MYVYKSKNGQIVKEGYDGDSHEKRDMKLFYLFIFFIVFAIIISYVCKRESYTAKSSSVTPSAPSFVHEREGFRFY